MGRSKFQQLRLALFIRSYCSAHLIKKITADFQNDPDQAKTELSLLAGALNLKKYLLQSATLGERRLRCFIDPKKFLFPKDKFEIPIFLAIEKEMVDISKKGFVEDLLEVDDYHGAVLQSAVERAVGNKLAKIDNDHEFDTMLLPCRL